MQPIAFSVNVTFAFSNKNKYMCYFKTILEILKLITSENIKNSIKLKTHKRIVLILNKFIFLSPNFLYNC